MKHFKSLFFCQFKRSYKSAEGASSKREIKHFQHSINDHRTTVTKITVSCPLPTANLSPAGSIFPNQHRLKTFISPFGSGGSKNFDVPLQINPPQPQPLAIPLAFKIIFQPFSLKIA